MAWPTFEIASWQHFHTLVDRFPYTRPHATLYLMRGQANADWVLSPSLRRLFPSNITMDKALAVERVSLREFRAQAHLHLSSAVLPNSFPRPPHPEWWALMQHHHAPTRLLDWSRSPFVGAYFAVEQQLEIPGAIFVVHMPTASQKFIGGFPSGQVTNEQLEDPGANRGLLFWEPSKKSERYVAQQGYFSLSVNLLEAQDQLIDEQFAAALQTTPSKSFFEKWIIPARLKLEFLSKLRAMNIAAHSLFPGIDGLGRSLGEVARMATIVSPDVV